MSFINPSLLSIANAVDIPEEAIPEQAPTFTKAEIDEQARKDRALGELLATLDASSPDNNAPILPDALMNYYLEKSGFSSPSPQITKLLGLATQKFISDIVTDAHAYAQARTVPVASKGPLPTIAKSQDKQKTVLTMDDLSAALSEYGIPASRAPYYL